MSKREVIDIIKSYLYLLESSGIPIEIAYLYGSYARNEANKNSDIDVMLVSDFFDTDDVYILSKPWNYTTNIDYRIEPVAISSKRFKTDDVSPLLEMVRREGIEITVKSNLS